MVVTTVTIFVKPEYIDDFIRATAENHRGSVQEPGNLRFDVLQCTDDPTRFLLYEAYESEEAAAAHKQTPHYLAWRAAVEPWMARPRQGVPHRVLFPADRSQW
ncbi:MAG: antibiotic biosynthesis monooxygenase [Candidatus Oleimicrobiaceae bacterium]